MPFSRDRKACQVLAAMCGRGLPQARRPPYRRPMPAGGNQGDFAMSYVDGFVLAVPKDKVDEYKKMATLGRDMWMKHGALAYLEAVADDVPHGELTSFPRAVMAKDDETTVFAYIVFRDRAHRDEVNKKVMADPDMKMETETSPFDMKRMIYGGFQGVVEG